MPRPAAHVRDRPLGPRALRTRRRLLDATAALLEERGLRGVSVVEIARRAGTSPASFYQYFAGVEAAALALAKEAAAGMPALLAILEGPFEGDEARERARALVAGFLDLWDRHHAVLRIRNHAAEEGSRSFRRARREALRPLLDALAQRLGAGEAAPAHPGFHPYAAAAALATVLESVGAHHRELETFGAGRSDLIETSARILVDTLAAARGAAS
jgi:AcrR family transcriptional regulator